MSDLWGWDRGHCGWGALCCLQWVCFPSLPALLWVRKTWGKPGLSSVQDQIQTYQRWDWFCVPFGILFVLLNFSHITIDEWTAGSPRVEGDEDEDGADDLDNEFDYGDFDALGTQPMSESLYSGRPNTGRGSNNVSGIATNLDHGSAPLNSEIPLLTYGEEVVHLRIFDLAGLIVFLVGIISSHRELTNELPCFTFIGSWDIFG